MKYIDVHCHLSDVSFDNSVEQIISSSNSLGIDAFLQGGVGPEDWQKQIDLKAKYGKQILLSFGLHPYWVSANDEELCEIALDQLARAIAQADALGELGLDFRPHIMKNTKARQISMFESQLEIAEFCLKPIVLHLVQAHEDAIRILDIWGVPPKSGFVHSFNGSISKAEDFIKRGLYLSIGGAVTYDKNEKLHNAVAQIPLEYLLIESDAPDQPPVKYRGEQNKPDCIWEVAKKVGQLRQLEADEVLRISTSNFKRLFELE